MTPAMVPYPLGASKHGQRREEVAVQADRRAQAHGGGRGARRPERPHAGALRDAGALLRARQAQPPCRAERLLQRPAEPQPRAGAPRPVPFQARGPRAAPGGAPPPRGRRQTPGAVQRAAGSGGQAELGEAAARWRWRVLQVERVLVRRRHGRRCREGGRLGERHRTADAAEGEEGQRRYHGDAEREVAQVNVLRRGMKPG